MIRLIQFIMLIFLVAACHSAPLSHTKKSIAEVWEPDLGNGHYKNPIIHADYSDPDVIRVNNTFYMTASSFNKAPGLPLLESKDMIHWEIVGYALAQLIPSDFFSIPQPGKGVWAPCLRFHDGKFWIFYPDPDFGIYVMTAQNFRGPWSEPHLLLAGKGLIDPTPLWDDDGRAYLLHAWAKSRAGINNLLTLRKMSPDAQTILDESGKIVINGNDIPNYRTLEGPKFYKRNNFYYVFAPAGGVETGWQSVFRAKNIEGPYEEKIVMDQGDSLVNGPHQGAWVENADGSNWFFHFQDMRAYGRIIHLQPMHWKNDWPVIGEVKTYSDKGQPVVQYKKTIESTHPYSNPVTTDEFSMRALGMQWQWNANWKSEWYSLQSRQGYLRLFAQNDANYQHNENLWQTPFVLSQKFPAAQFSVTAQIDTTHLRGRFGLISYGFHYGWVGVEKLSNSDARIIFAECENAEQHCHEQITRFSSLRTNQIFLKMSVKPNALVDFYFSSDGKNYFLVKENMQATQGRWMGAQIGLIALNDQVSENNFSDVKRNDNFVDVNFVRIEP